MLCIWRRGTLGVVGFVNGTFNSLFASLRTIIILGSSYNSPSHSSPHNPLSFIRQRSGSTGGLRGSSSDPTERFPGASRRSYKRQNHSVQGYQQQPTDQLHVCNVVFVRDLRIRDYWLKCPNTGWDLVLSAQQMLFCPQMKYGLGCESGSSSCIATGDYTLAIHYCWTGPLRFLPVLWIYYHPLGHGECKAGFCGFSGWGFVAFRRLRIWLQW